MARSLAAVEGDVRHWIAQSTYDFGNRYDERGQVWLAKFMSPRFLKGFLRDKRMAISATPGFTWGDAIYAAPLSSAYSGMIYGRAGIVGWLAWNDGLHTFDATGRGVDLYLEWSRFSLGLQRWLATTVHANLANRVLRNAFRRKFGIDVVAFPPDQFNRVYSNPVHDTWFAISDWLGSGPQAPGQRPAMSSRVQECEWVAMVEEEFEESVWKVQYAELFRTSLHGSAPPPLASNLPVALKNAHSQVRAGNAGVLRIDA